MMLLRKILFLIAVISLFLNLQSCSVSRDVKINQVTLSQGKIDDLQISPDISKDMPLKIAILPFENLTKDFQASELVRKSFFNYFSSKKFKDIELFKINSVLQTHDLLENQDFLKKPCAEIGDLLNAQGLIYGKITAFDRFYAGAYSKVSVELEAKLVRTADGKVLWKAKHKSSKHEGGIPLDPLSAIPAIFKTFMNIADIELLRTSEELVRNMLETLPEPDIGKIMEPPRIELMAHDSRDKWKKTGDLINVTLKGRSGMIASFDIGEKIKNIPMKEGEQGIYSGNYTVMQGDSISKGIVTGNLMDGHGNASNYVDPLGLINIDTIAPDIPKNFFATPRDRSIFLQWDETIAKDIIEYKLFRSNTPKTGYKQTAVTQVNTFHDKNLENDKTYYYKILAKDIVGNESEMSDHIFAIAVKPGPTQITHNIETDTVWYEGASPYIIEKSITILNDSCLTIQPGSHIKFKGSGIIVKGRLTAIGEKNNFIQITGMEQKKGLISWKGIVFDNTNDTRSIIEYCKIKNAKTAIKIVSSSPLIKNNIITKNNTGIKLSEFSKSKIQSNTIISNNFKGIICENSDPEISENNISNNFRGGIKLIDSNPDIMHNNIFDNKEFDLFAQIAGTKIFSASDNWWGTTKSEQISKKIKGSISYAAILDSPYPAGKPIWIADKKEITKLWDKADKLLKEKQTKKAKQILQKIIAVKPDDHKALFWSGMINLHEQKIIPAIEYLKRSVIFNGENPVYYFNLGMAYKADNQMENAVKSWKKTLKLDQNHSSARTLLELYDKK